MHFHHKLQSALSPAYIFSKKITNNSLKSINSLRVLAFHDIPENEIEPLKNQLTWLKHHWNILNPNEFELMMDHKKPVIGKNVLITFDDGFISNRVIADEILNPLNVKAIFFIVSDFASINDLAKSQLFISKNIMPNSSVNEIPRNLGNMNWDDLEVLVDYGHTIGSHTKSHYRLAPGVEKSILESQIIDSGNIISNRLGVSIDHFAYTFGDVDSFSENALRLAKKRYKFIYSGVRGDNIECLSSNLIRRDAASFQLKNNEYKLFSNRLLESFLFGLADFKYKKSRIKMDSWTLK